jgi:hypothetical protein
MPRQSKPRPIQEVVSHLEEGLVTPEQWDSWCGLWRRLLVKAAPPAAPSTPDAAQEEDRCQDREDRQGRG